MPASPRKIPEIWTVSRPIKGGTQLAGNRQGLLLLRKKIDEALETGAAQCEPTSCDWSEIRVVEEWPWKQPREESAIRYVVGLVAVATVVGTLMLIFGLGVHDIISWWK